METDKHYLMVGSFVLLILLAAAAFSVWLAGAENNGKYTPYRIHFAESVSGLDVGGPVKFRGVQVGKVKSITIDPHDMRLIRVDISILRTTPIRTDTVANLKLQGITGSVYIELSGTTPEAPDLAANNSGDSDNPPEIPAQTSTLTALMDMLPEITQKISHTTDQIDKLFSDKNISALSDTIGNAQKASHDFDELTHSIKQDPSKLIIPPKEKGIPAP